MSSYELRCIVAAKILSGMIASSPMCDRTKVNKKKWASIADKWALDLMKECEKERK